MKEISELPLVLKVRVGEAERLGEAVADALAPPSLTCVEDGAAGEEEVVGVLESVSVDVAVKVPLALVGVGVAL